MPEIKSLVEAKLTEAKTAGRVNRIKAGQAIEAAGVSDDLRKQLEDVADTQIKARGRISRPTALLVDKSSSMMKRSSSARASADDGVGHLRVRFVRLCLRHNVHQITAKGKSLADWEALPGHHSRRLDVVRRGPQSLERKGQLVEQVVLISDEQQNTPPTFVDALREYGKARQVQPSAGDCAHAGGERLCREGVPP